MRRGFFCAGNETPTAAKIFPNHFWFFAPSLTNFALPLWIRALAQLVRVLP